MGPYVMLNDYVCQFSVLEWRVDGLAPQSFLTKLYPDVTGNTVPFHTLEDVPEEILRRSALVEKGLMLMAKSIFRDVKGLDTKNA